MNIKGMTFYKAAALNQREKNRLAKWQKAQERKQAKAGKGKKNGS